MSPSELPTLSAESQKAASDLLIETWQTGGVIEALPTALRPVTRAAAYAVQALLEARSSRPLRGWKIAATSTAGQTHINVDGPLAGRLLAERAFAPGAALSLDGNRMRVAEPEFAFRFARDLPPRETVFTTDEVMAAVGGLHPAIEIPDSRYRDFTSVGALQLIADNACAHEFVLGAAAPDIWRTLDLVAHQVHGAVAGRIERTGIGANVLGDPRAALAWLVNELRQHGVTLRAGQVVTTGTCMVPLAITPGDKVSADFGELGHVHASFSGV